MEEALTVKWEIVASRTTRLKVEGGHLYETFNGLCFVPDIDLTRYQAHLRDAYNKGYQDGHADGKRA